MTRSDVAPAPAATPAPADRRPGWWQRESTEPVRRNLALVGVLALLVAVGAYTRPDIYLNSDLAMRNILTILTQASTIGVLTIGMTFVIIAGGIDLSVGSLVGLASVWCTTLATQSYGWGGMVFAAIVVGAMAGLINGTLIAYGRLVPFIATLAMLVAARGLAARISAKRTQVNAVTEINNIAETRILGIPLLVLIFAGVVAVGWVLLNRTTFGRRTVAIGGNPEAARLAGINVRWQTLLVYGLSGLCAGIAAIMLVSQTNSGASTNGEFWELDAIAAAIIGGTALSGGRGTIIGSLLGVVVFATITNLFILNNLPIEVQNIVKGDIIVGAVLLQQFRVGGLIRRKVAAQPGASP